MAKISVYDQRNVYGGLRRDAGVTAASMLEGKFVGISSGSGTLLIADHRAQQPRVYAVGCLLQSAELKDPKGNVVETVREHSYVRQGKLAGLTGLKPGHPYWLSSGGDITINKPTTTNEIQQQVGVAESATVLIIDIGPGGLA